MLVHSHVKHYSPMSQQALDCVQIKDELLELLAAACILIASRQGEVSVHIPTEADFQKVTGYTVGSNACFCTVTPLGPGGPAE